MYINYTTKDQSDNFKLVLKMWIERNFSEKCAKVSDGYVKS